MFQLPMSAVNPDVATDEEEPSYVSIAYVGCQPDPWVFGIVPWIVFQLPMSAVNQAAMLGVRWTGFVSIAYVGCQPYVSYSVLLHQ